MQNENTVTVQSVSMAFGASCATDEKRIIEKSHGAIKKLWVKSAKTLWDNMPRVNNAESTITILQDFAAGYKTVNPSNRDLFRNMNTVAAELNALLSKCFGDSAKLVHFHNGGQHSSVPASFTYDEKPKKAPKADSVGEVLPQNLGTPEREAETVEKVAGLIKQDWSEAAIFKGLQDGTISATDLKKALARYEASTAKKAVKKAVKKAEQSIDSQLAEQFKKLGLAS